MAEAEIARYADFDHIRYAQLWEDADVLLPALKAKKGATLVSICAAGDNALAMLTLDPKKVVAVDLSAAQISCLKLRIAAFQTLTHSEFIELSGSRASDRRGELLDKVGRNLEPVHQRFWQSRKEKVIAYGFGGIGKFETRLSLLMSTARSQIMLPRGFSTPLLIWTPRRTPICIGSCAGTIMRPCL